MGNAIFEKKELALGLNYALERCMCDLFFLKYWYGHGVLRLRTDHTGRTHVFMTNGMLEMHSGWYKCYILLLKDEQIVWPHCERITFQKMFAKMFSEQEVEVKYLCS